VFGISLLAAAICLGAPVQVTPSSIPGAPGTPWIRSGSVYGYLFYYGGAFPLDAQPPRAEVFASGVAPNGTNMKILWYVPQGSLYAVVRGFRLDAAGSFTQRLRVAQNGFYPSIMGPPSPGCWRVTVRSGKRRRRFAFLAI
jgi:hypothetical protein